MDISTAFSGPQQRMSIANLATAETLVMQYNPESLREEIEAIYAEQTIEGMSHQQQQYTATKNHHFPAIVLSFDSLTKQAGGKSYDLLKARNFLQAMMYSSRASKDVASGAPPRALFVWPGFISMRCHIWKLSFDNWRFPKTPGAPSGFRVTVDLKEVRDVRLFMEDVLSYGTLRPSMGAT